MPKAGCFFCTILFFFFLTTVYSQPDYHSQDRCKEEDIPHYTAYRTSRSLHIDGRLDEPAWKKAPKSARFADLISGAATALDTRAAVLWDDQYLYVGYWLEEPDITATHTQRDALQRRFRDAGDGDVSRLESFEHGIHAPVMASARLGPRRVSQNYAPKLQRCQRLPESRR